MIVLFLPYLMQIIYVNSTISDTIRVEKSVPAFKAWSSTLLYSRQKEELELGFGCLPFAEGVEVIQPLNKKKLIKKLKKNLTGIINKKILHFEYLVYF